MSEDFRNEDMNEFYFSDSEGTADAITREDKTTSEFSDGAPRNKRERLSSKAKPERKTLKKKPAPKPTPKKTMKVFLRILVLVVLFCVVVFGGIIVSDLIFGDDTTNAEPEIIAITVSGETIILNENEEVTYKELENYLNRADSRGELVTVALINDTSNPADAELYNKIVDLLAKYGIICDKMDLSTTQDRATLDEITT
ncbi:MAG: hypothetical protein IJC86_02745 [Clostridia bacterium]|nr:hypothetical protein [Clostridia bacterium]